MTPKKTTMSNRDFLFMIVPVILALLVVAFTIGLYVSQKMVASPQQGQLPQSDSRDEANDQVADVGDDTEGGMQDDAPEEVRDLSEINVTWYKAPKEITPYLAVETAAKAAQSPSNGTGSLLVGAYELGLVESGEYEGATITMQIIKDDYDMGGPFFSYHYVLIPDSIREKPLWFERYYGSAGSFFGSLGTGGDVSEKLRTALSQSFIITSDLLSGMEDVTVSLSGGAILKTISVGAFNYGDYGTNGVKFGALSDDAVVGNQGGPIYRADNGLFYRERIDGRIVWYDIRLAFWNTERLTDAQSLTISSTVSGGTVVHTGEYIKGKPGGCGYSTYTNVSTVPADATKIKSAGVINAGGSSTYVYELTESGLADRRNDLDSWLRWNEGKTVDDFVAMKPYLYVQDGLGRWIELQNVGVLGGAECGKPVIYLYPEKEMDALVEVAPVGGFTKVEPAYNDGWRVTASPDGKLINKDDGKTYPYLFWEGRGGLYEEPQQYWVLKREEIGKALPKILWQLGLNAIETRDFMEFWEPLMQDAPYYKVGFHGNMVMEALAPLTVTPGPESTLRILMDYSELEAPIEANPPQLPSRFERNGFTVVEWGGVLRHE